MNSTSGRRAITGLPSRTSYLVRMLLPITSEGGTYCSLVGSVTACTKSTMCALLASSFQLGSRSEGRAGFASAVSAVATTNNAPHEKPAESLLIA